MNYTQQYERIPTFGAIEPVRGGSKKNNIRNVYMKGGNYEHDPHYDMDLAPRGAGYMPIKPLANCGMDRPSGLKGGRRKHSRKHRKSSRKSHMKSSRKHRKPQRKLSRKHRKPHRKLSRRLKGGVRAIEHGTASYGFAADTDADLIYDLRGSRAPMTAHTTTNYTGGYNQFMNNVAYTPSYRPLLHTDHSALANPVPIELVPAEQTDPYVHHK